MKWKKMILISIMFFFFISILFQPISGCKDIIACGNTTQGEYNLLLKVRDPSRPGYQVLTIVPKGYSYEYHHPWTGTPLSFEFDNTFIGVTSVGDTIPQIVKAGMCFTDAGLAFGDADTNSNWKNPTIYGWDDFDWIRYACQTADDEDEAVHLLTKVAVDQLHASRVPENLFVLGSEKGYVIEADMLHYNIKDVSNEIVVMSNYVKNLWRKSIFLRSISPSFNSTFHEIVQRGQIARLGKECVFGIKIVYIGPDYIDVKQVPLQFNIDNMNGKTYNLFSTTRILLNTTEKIGFYRVKLYEILGREARISICYEYKEWEDKMQDIIQPEIGNITINHMIQWSRLHDFDLDGMRGMCDDHELFPYEGSMIYKIPEKYYEYISEGWFAANHPCSTIYVPVHICNTEIYDPYETGEVAKLSLSLLEIYGHDVLSYPFQNVELVFQNELNMLAPIINDMLLENDEEISFLLTNSDVGMQEQAFLTQKLWLNLSEIPHNEEIKPLLFCIWQENYSTSLKNMEEVILILADTTEFDRMVKEISNIAISIIDTRITLAERLMINSSNLKSDLIRVEALLQEEKFAEGFQYLQSILNTANFYLLKNDESPPNYNLTYQMLSLLLFSMARVPLKYFKPLKKRIT
jgi:hypothetical protein